MENKNVLEKYEKRAKQQGIAKAVVFAAIVAFIACFVTSFAIWFTDFKGWWVALIVYAVVMAATAPAAYFLKYKPDVKDVARRLDRLGLDERIITMTELEGVDNVMANRQRQSAVNALGAVPEKMLKFALSGLTIAALAVSCVFGIGMTTVKALSSEGKMGSGSEVIGGLTPDPDVYYTVRYAVYYADGQGKEVKDGFGCEIDGNDEQLVLAGGDAEPVLAYVEDEGGEEWVWMFYGWFDEVNFENEPLSQDPYRQDTEIGLDSGVITYEDDEIVITHTAVFVQVSTGDADGEGDGLGEGEGMPPDDEDAQDKPQEGGEDGEGDPSDSEDGENPGPGSGDSNYDPDNQIIDGETDYREHLEEYLQLYQEYLENGNELPDYLKDFIEIYYGIIA